MSLPARISIVSLGVDDLARAAEFYEALGWDRAAASNDEVVWFVTSDSVLGLYSRRLLAEEANQALSSDRGFGGVTLAINVESEQLVDAILAAATEAGAELLRPAERAHWGGYHGYFADPDGHPWEVAYNPFVPIDERGRLVME